jgi:hypothetical protein
MSYLATSSMFNLAYITIPIILILQFVLSTGPTDSVHISGHVRNDSNYRIVLTKGMTLIAKQDDNIIAKTITGPDGEFELTISSSNQHLDFFCEGIATGTLYVGSLQISKHDTTDIILDVPHKT